jgi:hypothetical protein
MKPKAKQPTPVQWWQPPFSDSPDPAVRKAFAEFTARKGDEPYSVGDVIAHLERRVPQRSRGGNGNDAHVGQLGIGLTRWLRELRA